MSLRTRRLVLWCIPLAIYVVLAAAFYASGYSHLTALFAAAVTLAGIWVLSSVEVRLRRQAQFKGEQK